MLESARALAPRDYDALRGRYIDKETADRNLLSRVDSLTGGAILGRNGAGNYAGILIPYRWPGEQQDRAHRIRRDHPEYENGKPKQKYMASPGSSNLLYFPPETDPAWLQDQSIPIAITEGEFKALALFRAAHYELGDSAERPRMLPIGLSGVWNWRGVIGKTVDADGTRVDETGPIPDLSRVAWTDRRVTVIFDADLLTNDSVCAARALLSKDLRGRGARVHWFKWPAHIPQGVKGIDDLLAGIGPADVLSLINNAPSEQKPEQKPERRIHSVSDVRSIQSYASRHIDFIIPGILAAGTVTAITGDSGAGKTTFATALCGAVARGTPFAGRDTQKRAVLVLDRENPLPVVVERFERLGIEDGPDFVVWGGWADDEAPFPNSPVVLDWVTKCNPKPLVVIDSFIAFHEGSENDSAEMRKTMQGLRSLADLGATVIPIHHSGKGDSTKEYRGSSDFKAGIDVGYVFANMSSDPSRLATVRLKAFKARFTIEAEVILQYRNGRFEGDGVKTTSDLLQEVLIANPGIGSSEFESIAADKSLGRNEARKFLNGGVESGKIRSETGAHNAKLHTWIGGRKAEGKARF